MKKIILYPWVFCLTFSTLLPATNKKTLSLPVRIIENAQESEELTKTDIKFLINGNLQKVTGLIRKNRSLSHVPDLGRHFILSFHNVTGTKTIENLIAYFITEILDPKDSLIILSPITAYRIPVTRDKEKMIMDISRLLDKDCSLHERDRISAEKKLENGLHRLNTIATDRAENFSSGEAERSDQVLAQATNLTTNYKAIYQVLLNFPQNFSRFKDQYLLPGIVKHNKINEFLGTKPGEKWWIHFQQREDIRIIQKARAAGRNLNAYISKHETGSLARTMQKSISDLEKQLLISESIPQEEILDSLLGKNICYNVVFFGSIKSDEAHTSFKETSDLHSVLRRIARYSGGKAVVATDPEKGLNEIKKHSDRYYDLVFELDRNTGELKFHISSEGSHHKFSYKQNFSKEEMDEWIRSIGEKKVQIQDFSLDKRAIHFSIGSFMQNRDKQFGLLKVRLRLIDKNNAQIYKTENTLRASEERVTVSVPMPLDYRGRFRLSIEVFDLLANNSSTSEYFIDLD